MRRIAILVISLMSLVFAENAFSKKILNSKTVSTFYPFKNKEQQIMACGLIAAFSDSRGADFGFDTSAARDARKSLRSSMSKEKFSENDTYVTNTMKSWNDDKDFNSYSIKCKKIYPM